LDAVKAKRILMATRRTIGAKVSPKVYTFHLTKPLSNKASLVPHNLTILLLVVFENPLGSYNIHISRGLNYGSNLVSLKIL
jgi:hypothetical protein